MASTSLRTSIKASAPEFQLLGLRPREARLDVIRRALTETAGDVKASEHWAAEACTAGKGLQSEDGRLAQVAVAGYRLLDPRRRRTLFERVQLLLWTEEDYDGPSTSLWDSVPKVERNAQPNAPASPRMARSQAKLAAAKPAAAKPAVATPTDAKPDEAKPTDVSAAPVTSPAEETQAALEVFRSLRSRDRRATALWISVAALAISLPGAVALVLALL